MTGVFGGVICEVARIACNIASYDSTMIVIGVALFVAVLILVIRDILRG